MREKLVRRNFADSTLRTSTCWKKESLFHYAMLLTMYSAGLRRSEMCKLKVSNIDSGRMVIRIERGKGGVDREVPLNPGTVPKDD